VALSIMFWGVAMSSPKKRKGAEAPDQERS